jgi:hypothetical protein
MKSSMLFVKRPVSEMKGVSAEEGIFTRLARLKSEATFAWSLTGVHRAFSPAMMSVGISAAFPWMMLFAVHLSSMSTEAPPGSS